MSKTVRLYHFVNHEFGLHDIRERHLKVAFADRVNDLFEFCPFDFGEKPGGRTLRTAWREAIKTYSLSQGFISFSQSWSVPTMWAHYADSHKGVCLGFDVRMSRDDGAPYGVKIAYVKELRPMDERVLRDEKYNARMVEIAKKTKSIHWKYEDEWRIWSSLTSFEKQEKLTKPDKNFYKNFDEKLVLREVIFGHNSELSTSEVRDHLTPSDEVEFTTARPSFRAFKMVRQRLKKYQK